MNDSATRPRIVRFGVFEVDLKEAELRRSGHRRKLAPQPFRVLQALLERPGELVTREELRQLLWPGTTYVDYDLALKKSVYRIREVLGDSAENPRFVETVQRRGYRFIAPIRAAEVTPTTTLASSEVAVRDAASGENSDRSGSATESGHGAPARLQKAEPQGERTGVSRSSPLRRYPVQTLACLVALTGLLVVFSVGGLRDSLLRRVSSGPIKSLAVLPLQNLSGDSSQGYLADGITEQLITDLAMVGTLRVISHTSVMQYGDSRKSLPQIARELSVDAVVEGTVAGSGGRVRVTAHLVQARTGRHLWTATYDRDLRDVLALEANVARDITRQIGMELTPGEQTRAGKPHPGNLEAYRAYVEGRADLHDRTGQGLQDALERFKQAIQYDADYAPAYAGLADTYVVLGHYGYLPSRDAGVQAKMAATKAIQLDCTLADAHTSLAMVMFAFDWDWPGADNEFRRAISLNPGYATAHHWYAHYLVAMGRLNEALAEIQKARDLDPFSPPINLFTGMTLYFSRRFDPATDYFRYCLQQHSDWADKLHGWMGDVYWAKGMQREAIDQWQESLELSGNAPLSALLASAYAKSGYRGYLEKQLEYSEGSSTKSLGAAMAIAQVAARLGDKDRTLRWLEKAYDERNPWVLNLNVDPVFDTVRTDPRFRTLVRQIGLQSTPPARAGGNPSATMTWQPDREQHTEVQSTELTGVSTGLRDRMSVYGRRHGRRAIFMRNERRGCGGRW